MSCRCPCSNKPSCSVRSALHQAAAAPCTYRARATRRQPSRCRAAAPSEPEPQLQTYSSVFFTPENKWNREPDYSDPDWFENVTDWDEYWNHTRFDMESAQALDDYVDTSGNRTDTVEHAIDMINAIQQIAGRPEVDDLLTTTGQYDHTDTYNDPPVPPETQSELPNWSYNDWRAFAEKQREYKLLDIEWRRRQAKVGRLEYPHKDNMHDVRMRAFDYLGERLDYTEQEMDDLITMNGTACHPDDYKAHIDNPLAPADYVNTYGVVHIEETEDFLRRSGHLAEPPPLEVMSEEMMADLLQNSPSAQFAEDMIQPHLDAVAMHQEAAQRRKLGNTWLGDAIYK